jgi:hypothetical protein
LAAGLAAVLTASCQSIALLHRPLGIATSAQTVIVARGGPPGGATLQANAPALVARPAGTAAAPEVLPVARTRVAATMIGPIATIERAKTYTATNHALEVQVSFTPPAVPARQDYAVRVGERSILILVRERLDAQDLARTRPDATLVTTDEDGRVAIPVGTITAPTIELAVETTSLAPWHGGAYEITVPRAPEGEVALVADVYGPGPIVVMSSPSHAIDTVAESLEHLRVSLRDPGTLRDDDFVLRYRVDPADHPGALVVAPDGAGDIIAIVVHPFEDAHEPIAASDVTIDWNGAEVTDVRPAIIGPVAAGTPLVVLARAHGQVGGPIVLHARVGRQTRSLSLARDDAIPRSGLRALPLLWARAAHPIVTARR